MGMISPKPWGIARLIRDIAIWMAMITTHQNSRGLYMVFQVCRAWRKASRMGRGCMSVEKNGCRERGSMNRVAKVGMAARIKPRGEGVPLAILKKYGDISQKCRPSKTLKNSRAGSMQNSNRTICPACLHAAENGSAAAAPFASYAA